MSKSNPELHHDIDRLTERLRALSRRHHVPGGSLSLIAPDAPLTDVSFGVCEEGGEAVVDSETVFEGASLAKPIFAHWLLEEAAKGRFDLDRPVLDHFEDRQFPEERWGRIEVHPVFAERVTARQILGHTSGLGNWQEDRINRFSFEPGSDFRYSGEGFTLLQRAVEQERGAPIETFLNRDVFEVLGMHRSALVWDADSMANFAIGHGERNDGVGSEWSEAAVAYSLYTTAHDYARFIEHLLSLDDARDPLRVDPVVSVTPHVSWTLGWGHQRSDSQVALFQWGDLGDFTAFAIRFPEQKRGMVLVTNGAEGLRIARTLVAELYDGPHPCFPEFVFNREFSD
jgi:CubicO group peptidase (beta-lactamase class C family)